VFERWQGRFGLFGERLSDEAMSELQEFVDDTGQK
jgi:hypothetical protein